MFICTVRLKLLFRYKNILARNTIALVGTVNKSCKIVEFGLQILFCKVGRYVGALGWVKGRDVKRALEGTG